MKSILAEVLSQTQKEYGCTPIAFTTKIVFYCMIRKKDLRNLMSELMIEPSSKINTKSAFTYHSDFGDIRFIVTKSVKEPIVSTRLHYDLPKIKDPKLDYKGIAFKDQPSLYMKKCYRESQENMRKLMEKHFIDTSPVCEHTKAKEMFIEK